MLYFAHSGVDHTAASEAASRSAPGLIAAVLLASAAAVAFVAGVLYLLNRFSFVELPVKEDKK
ncbi:MAG: hypothetical protein WAQ57_01490 [Candidatus Saccharimonadales bacterium]